MQEAVALDLLFRVKGGSIDEAVSTWLARGIDAWIRGRGSITLEDALDLPSPRRTSIAIRDYWLSIAANVTGYSAARLHRAATNFERSHWPLWRDLAVPPSAASQIEVCLFHARRAGEFPTSRRQYQRLLGHP